MSNTTTEAGPDGAAGLLRGTPFVVIEGIDGSGKSTQVRMLSEVLSARGVAHRVTEEPGGSPEGVILRDLLLGAGGSRLNGAGEMLAVSVARQLHVEGLIRPALARGEAVLCDRFALSTVAYQGYGRGVSLDLIRRVTAAATGGLEPDICWVLDVPPGVGRGRRSAAEGSPDRIESEGSEFMERVRRGYLEAAAEHPRIEVVNAGRGAKAVHADLLARMDARFPGLGG